MRASFAAAKATTSPTRAARRTGQGCRRHRGAQRSGGAAGAVLDASEHRATSRRRNEPNLTAAHALANANANANADTNANASASASETQPRPRHHRLTPVTNFEIQHRPRVGVANASDALAHAHV